MTEINGAHVVPMDRGPLDRTRVGLAWLLTRTYGYLFGDRVTAVTHAEAKALKEEYWRRLLVWPLGRTTRCDSTLVLAPCGFRLRTPEPPLAGLGYPVYTLLDHGRVYTYLYSDGRDRAALADDGRNPLSIG